MDKKANLIINAKCDRIMEIIMNKLNYEIPEWKSPIIIEKSSIEPKKLLTKAEININRRKRKSDIVKEEQIKKPALIKAE